MTLPLNKKQKQLVEKSMDLVPIMIRSMTRTAAYVTEEEQQELCQIGYLALCRSAVGFEEGRSFQPYAKTIIRHAIFDYWRKIARDRSMLCSLDEASSEDEHLHWTAFLPCKRSLMLRGYSGTVAVCSAALWAFCSKRARTAARSKSSPSLRAVIGFVLSGVR